MHSDNCIGPIAATVVKSKVIMSFSSLERKCWMRVKKFGIVGK